MSKRDGLSDVPGIVGNAPAFEVCVNGFCNHQTTGHRTENDRMGKYPVYIDSYRLKIRLLLRVRNS